MRTHVPIIHLSGTLLPRRASIQRKGVRMRRVFFVLMILGMTIAACAPAPAATEEPTYPNAPSYPSVPSYPNQQPTSTHIPVDLTPAQRAALAALSEQLNVAIDKVTLVSTEAVTWPN